MKLNDEQRRETIDKLIVFLATPCKACNGQGWILNDRIFELREFEGGSLTIGGDTSVFPVIPVSCQHCGNTLFFNAIQLGLIEKGNER